MNEQARTIGPLLRDWRRRRRLSQLDLAAEAEISQRHLSFVETGRAAPSRGMVARLAERLDVPMRERNALLVAAGYAPDHRGRALDDPEMAAALRAVELILAGHEPHPALAVDRHWTLVRANRALGSLIAGVDPGLMRPPVNVIRLSLHPDGLAPRIRNFREWRAHVVARLVRLIDATADPVLAGLLQEVRSYAPPPGARPYRLGGEGALGGIAIPLELEIDGRRLAFLGTTTVFGSALDVTLAEICIESFFPADAATAAAMAGRV